MRSSRRDTSQRPHGPARDTASEPVSVRDAFLRDIAEDTAATRRHTANLTAAVQGLALATIALTAWTLHKMRSRS